MIRKNILEDIKPITRKGGTNVPLPPVMTQTPSFSSAPITPSYVPPQPPPPRITLPREVPFEPSEPQGSSRYAIWYIAIAVIIGFLFSLSFLFERATVSITPKTMPIAFDSTDTFTAQKDTVVPDTIVYTVMSLSGDESMKLPSTKKKDESVPATGTVILYNAYSPSAYKLVVGTRLATPDGKIYTINTPVTIPGDTKSGTTVTPGSVTVNVTASVAGESSNIEQSDFTVPGLAATPQATKIYGRTKTAITGGLSGTIYSIDQDAANAALGTLQTKLKTSLTAKAKVQVPDGYLFYEGATLFQSDNAVTAPYSKTSDVPLALHGTLTAYLIKQDTLVQSIAEKFISQYNGEVVTMPQLFSVTLSPVAAMAPATDSSFAFNLSGTATLVWNVKPDDIKVVLAGRKKADFQAILGAQTGVDRAQVVIKPFWKQSFPTDLSRIQVTIQQPGA